MSKQTKTVGIEKTLLNEIIDLAKEYDLSKVVFFGSRARDDYRIYDYNPPYSNVVLTGLVGLFEICFEQSLCSRSSNMN